MYTLPSKNPLMALLCVGVFALGTSGSVAQNATGVTDKEVLIGSCAALEGPSSFLGRETVIGAETYFAMVNEEGGLHGRKLRLLSADDSYDPIMICQSVLKALQQKNGRTMSENRSARIGVKRPA